MEIAQEVVNFIERNKISTVEVADVLGKTGRVGCVRPLTPGLFRVGEVVCVYAARNTNYDVHRQLADADLAGKVLFVCNVDCDDAIFGDLVSKYILLYKCAKAIVVTGLLRDAHTLVKERYPIWLEGVSPIGCVNTPAKNPLRAAQVARLKARYDGAIMVCDDSGVVMIPRGEITQELLRRLERIEIQEDVWYYCLDTLKMSTFDIVCRKRYLRNGCLDQKLLDRLEPSKTSHRGRHR